MPLHRSMSRPAHSPLSFGAPKPARPVVTPHFTFPAAFTLSSVEAACAAVDMPATRAIPATRIFTCFISVTSFPDFFAQSFLFSPRQVSDLCGRNRPDFYTFQPGATSICSYILGPKSMAEQGKKDRTIATHAGSHPHDNQGVVNPPVYRASTVLFRSVQDLRERYRHKYETITYGRDGTQTHRALAEAFTALEGSERAIILTSGAAAVSASLLASLSPGDGLLMVDNAYEPTREICDGLLAKVGIEVTYYDPMIGAGIGALIRPNTKVVYLESPGSLTFETQDIPAIVAAAKKAGCRTIMDNTWATPLFFKPPQHGIDISVYSASKYIGGHSDMMMGILACPAALLRTVGKMAHGYMGHATSADDCYNALRGLRTLHAR